jgi:threonine synthase
MDRSNPSVVELMRSALTAFYRNAALTGAPSNVFELIAHASDEEIAAAYDEIYQELK